MKARRKLFASRKIYDLPESDAVYTQAMRENCRFQYEHCKEYKRILDRKGFSPDEIRSLEDLERLPFIPTSIFKKHRLMSMPKWQTLISATSSGTSGGSVSKISFELSGMWCALKMVLRVVPKRGVLSAKPCNYIVFGYKPNIHNHTAVTKTAFGTTLLAPGIHRTYALKYKNGQYEADLEGVIDAILKYSKKKIPMRFMGFPSYTFFVMQMLKERGIHVHLPKGSMIMIAGGWKQFYTEEVGKDVFYQLAEETLGVKQANIVEFFGAVEHPVLYMTCPKHHFHVPVYSRVLIRDVRTFKVLPYGTPGLVNLTTPMIKATPILSVMTDDLGILHEGKECGCGCEAPYLEILGRVGLKDIKTCAAGAAKLLNTSSLTGGMGK